MKSLAKTFLFSILTVSLVYITSCDEGLEDLKDCTGCSDDAPYSAIDGSNCYATLSACEGAESGNCVICQ